MGIARVVSNGLNGVPTLYTTYNRAIEYLPSTRFTMSYVLVQPKNDAAVAGIKQQVAKLGTSPLPRTNSINAFPITMFTRPALAPTSC